MPWVWYGSMSRLRYQCRFPLCLLTLYFAILILRNQRMLFHSMFPDTAHHRKPITTRLQNGFRFTFLFTRIHVFISDGRHAKVWNVIHALLDVILRLGEFILGLGFGRHQFTNFLKDMWDIGLAYRCCNGMRIAELERSVATGHSAAIQTILIITVRSTTINSQSTQ